MASKTARASAVKEVAKPKIVIPDADMVRILRTNTDAGIFTANIDFVRALFRTLDQERVDHTNLVTLLRAEIDELKTVKADVEHLQRQLVLANSVIETYKKAQADMAAVVGAPTGSYRD